MLAVIYQVIMIGIAADYSGAKAQSVRFGHIPVQIGNAVCAVFVNGDAKTVDPKTGREVLNAIIGIAGQRCTFDEFCSVCQIINNQNPCTIGLVHQELQGFAGHGTALVGVFGHKLCSSCSAVVMIWPLSGILQLHQIWQLADVEVPQIHLVLQPSCWKVKRIFLIDQVFILIGQSFRYDQAAIHFFRPNHHCLIKTIVGFTVFNNLNHDFVVEIPVTVLRTRCVKMEAVVIKPDICPE